MPKMLDGPNGVLLIDVTDSATSMERTLLFEQGKFFISGLEISKISSFEPLPKYTNSMFAIRDIDEYLLGYHFSQDYATKIVSIFSELYKPNYIRFFTPEHNKRTCMKSILVKFQDKPPHIYIEIQDNTLPNSFECGFEISVKPGENKYVKAFQEVCLVAGAIASGHISNYIAKSRLMGIKVEE